MTLKFLNLRYIVLALCVIGCTGDFEQVNTNPNNPLSTTPNLLLTGLERDMMNSLLNEAWGIGNIVIQHTAKNQFVNEDRYLWGELNGVWNAVYDNMRDVNNIIMQAKETNQTNYLGVALVMKSWMFSLATDCYGDVPYSQAAEGKSGVLFPQYDSQEDIYNGILSDLAEANSLLASAGNISGDLIYGGNVQKWRKLANSLRLRYLMRISDRRDVSNDMNAILSDLTAHPVFESNEDHAVYTYQASSPNQFPLFSTRIGSFNEFRASKTLVDFLSGLNDPRLYIYFRPTPVTEVTATTDDDRYDGIPNGLDDVIAQTYNGGQQFQARIGTLFYEQANTSLGIQVAKGVIMTYAELQFILAEAREKGLINIGNAETYYLNGINASFNYYSIDPDDNYFAQDNVTYTGTAEERLEKIGKQKWAAAYFQGYEAWFDWRRTGYPKLAPAVDNQNDDRIPVRFIFPRIEQSLNATNREAAIARQGADDINTRVWWDVNPN
jgi:hypothetical protein